MKSTHFDKIDIFNTIYVNNFNFWFAFLVNHPRRIISESFKTG